MRLRIHVFKLFIPFWLFESDRDCKSEQVRDCDKSLGSFSPPVHDYETRTHFHEGYNYGCKMTRYSDDL